MNLQQLRNSRKAKSQGNKQTETEWTNPAIFNYEMPDKADCKNPDIIIDSCWHGYGDCAVYCRVAAGAKLQGITIAHAVNNPCGMRDLALCFGQEIVTASKHNKEKMFNVNTAYFYEIEKHGKIGQVQNRCDFLGIKTAAYPTPIDIPPLIKEWVDTVIKKETVLLYPPVLLFPQCTQPIRTWPKNYFLVLREMLISQGYQPIICVWNNDGYDWIKYVGNNLLINPKWIQVVALMQKAKAVIGNNSGAVHVAGLLKVPAFVLAGAATAESLIGEDSLIQVAVSKQELPCVECYFQSPPKTKACTIACLALQMLTPNKVMSKFNQYLERNSYESKITTRI